MRYLQKAIMRLDYEQYAMVKEALHERANLLDIAPHLSFPLPIMLPVYKWWQVSHRLLAGLMTIATFTGVVKKARSRLCDYYVSLLC